jgi:hypothetical protein
MPRPARRAKRVNTNSTKDNPTGSSNATVPPSNDTTSLPQITGIGSIGAEPDNVSNNGDNSDDVEDNILKDIGNQFSSNDQVYADTNDESDHSFHPRQTNPPETKPPNTRKKPIRAVRTSQLLTLLPERHTRDPTKSKSRSKTSKSRKATTDAEADKENEVYEEDSEEEREREKRRKVAMRKFKEVDQWELEFESVDVSFCSEG